MSKLTEHLQSLDPTAYKAATQHPFLRKAGNCTLDLDTLVLWLSQDRIYAAHAYPRFIGTLISRIPFHTRDPISGAAESRNQEILKLLNKCLDNIVREVSFFKRTADAYGFDLGVYPERQATRNYTAEMARVASNASLEEGLVFLWAMEKVYLDAWTYVKDLQVKTLPPDSCGDLFQCVSAACEFAGNWSSPAFQAFVRELEDLVNSLQIQPGSDAWERAEAIWHRVIELEIDFWPPLEDQVQV